MSNHLVSESSPYLLQHKDNPVEWYPWGSEALSRARDEEKPIFLSIGYSACHWCHVMEHESFEDAGIASKLNQRFISIKVDREERPDLDQIYMNAVQAMTGRGGWPMSVFLTPDMKPFYGGTYWPPTERMGMPGFGQILDAVHDAWENRREQALQQAEQITEHIASRAPASDEGGKLSDRLLRSAATSLEQAFDSEFGGFGQAPKFPHPMDIQVLLRVWNRWPRKEILTMVELTLDRMASGGIHDHLAGGFARYSVDRQWLVPHFEKMLYDNALLASCYLDGYLATEREEYAQTVRSTLDYLLNDMRNEAGAIYSTEDADSEGVEGKFYVWTPAEIEAVLGADGAKTFCAVYDVTEAGNFEGDNILNLPKTLEQCAELLKRDVGELTAELAVNRKRLREVRNERIRPGLDDKVLVSWNALAIDALARAAGVLNEPRYQEAATQCATFLLDNMRRDDGRLLHTWRHGQAKLDAYLDDYATLANSLVSLYEATGNEKWSTWAVELAEMMLTHFADEENGGFFYTADDHEALISRNKDMIDSSVPSGNAMAATALLRIGRLVQRDEFVRASERTLQLGQGIMEQSPAAAGQMLLALDDYLGPSQA